MFLIKVVFSIFVLYSILPSIILAPNLHKLRVRSTLSTGRWILDGLQVQGDPDDTHQVQETSHIQPVETAKQKTPNDVLIEEDSQGPLHEEAKKVEGNLILDPLVLCPICFCKQPFHEACLTLCCGGPNSSDSSNTSFVHVNSQKTLTDSTPTTDSLTPKETHVTQDHQPDVEGHNKNSGTDSNNNSPITHMNSQKTLTKSTPTTNSSTPKETHITQDHQPDVESHIKNSETNSGGNEHQEDAASVPENQPVTACPESEPPMSSKSDTFNSDVSMETSHVSNSGSGSLNTSTVIFIVLLSLLPLWIFYGYARQWRRRKSRENYVINGLYNEARPLCLNDILEHRD